MNERYDALSLFSGGLDSLLAHKLVQRQGLRILGLHFVSPFFGKPHLLDHWRATYGVDVVDVDVGEAYVRMLERGPAHGLGSALNPCVDCKILMLAHAKTLLAQYGARFLVSGEVVGQRPMSQRRDALNAIRRDADVKDLLLRPLSALVLEPTPMEESGLVDRSRLLNAAGRGRAKQLALAAEMGITEIPTPGGGCRLTEKEPSARYAPIFRHRPSPSAHDFLLANTGRQFWSGPHWLAVGRDQADNERLAALVREDDIVLDLSELPSPLAVLRLHPDARGTVQEDALVADAAAFAASYSPKARRADGPVRVDVTRGGQTRVIEVSPSRNTPANWREPTWAEAEAWKKERAPVA